MSFVASLVCLILTAINITRAATITEVPKRAETTLPPELIGYTYSDGKFASFDCRESSAWQTIGSFGRCCLTARPDCFMATACLRGSVMANGDFESTCTGSNAQTECVTGTIYHSIGDQQPLMNYQCWPQWDSGNWDATIATTTQTSTLSSSVSSRTLSPGSSIPTSISSPTTSPSETSAAASTETRSKAWIAGPVIGSVLGAVFFTHFGMWLYRRRLQRQNSQHQDLLGSIQEQGSGVRYAQEGDLDGDSTKVGTFPQGTLVEVEDRGLHEADGREVGEGLRGEESEADTPVWRSR